MTPFSIFLGFLTGLIIATVFAIAVYAFEKRNKLKKLDELKSSFIASISHELRTPLHSVRESISLLRAKVGGNLNPRQEQLITIASNNIERLSRMIHNVLHLSETEVRQLHLKMAPFRLNDLISETVSTFADWAESKQITIELALPGPIDLEADRNRIGQVLSNLISNALKFTPADGKITVAARKKTQSASPYPVVEISVQDTGPGIRKQDFKKIFQKFTRMNTPILQDTSGIRLGLAVSKEIVQLHGGRIWMESEEGKGSRFIFELPEKNKTKTD